MTSPTFLVTANPVPALSLVRTGSLGDLKRKQHRCPLMRRRFWGLFCGHQGLKSRHSDTFSFQYTCSLKWVKSPGGRGVQENRRIKVRSLVQSLLVMREINHINFSIALNNQTDPSARVYNTYRTGVGK
jgi:hypothetical protein